MENDGACVWNGILFEIYFYLKRGRERVLGFVLVANERTNERVTTTDEYLCFKRTQDGRDSSKRRFGDATNGQNPERGGWAADGDRGEPAAKKRGPGAFAADRG